MADPSIDLETADLGALVAHRHTVQATMSVESAQAVLAQHDVDFLGVLAGERFIGVCARRELVQSLGSRFGFALNAHRPVSEHLMQAPLKIAVGLPLTEVFRAAAGRDSRELYDDVVLVDGAHRAGTHRAVGGRHAVQAGLVHGRNSRG